MTIRDDEFFDIPTPIGPMRVHISRPTAPGKYPGLLFFSEIFQITGPIRRAAAILASNGFVVAMPEIYHELEAPGTVLGYDEEGSARGNKDKTTKTLESYDSDARLTLDFLKGYEHCTGKLGAAGFCIGGHLAVRAALNPDVLATVAFYPTDIHKRSLGAGMHDNTLDRLGEIRGEIIFIWGRQDPHIPREGRAIVYNAVGEAGINFQWHEFNGAHAFMRDEGPRYNPAAATICYAMAFELFKRKLGEGGDLPVSAEGAAGETRH